jgi:hypothetical protein
MMVILAAGIKGCAAFRAAVLASHIFSNSQRGLASSAENGALLLFGGRPRFERVASQRVVTFFAGIEDAAAAHLDGDDVRRLVIVPAAGLRIELDAADFVLIRRELAMRHVVQLYPQRGSSRRPSKDCAAQ